MNEETYHINTEVFDGPLDLLLSLIEKRKLLINDIALSEVANDYLKYVERHDNLPVSETAQFVLVGSTLLLIKSKSLLPVLTLTDEEKNSVENLELRLKIFDKYKTIARGLVDIYDKSPLFTRKKISKRKSEFSPDKTITLENLVIYIKNVVKSLPKLKPTLNKTVVQKVVSLEDMMKKLTERINSSMQVSFRQFSSDAPDGKLNTIVSFLAMLELVRQGVIRVEQSEMFSDINMQSDIVDVPRYG